MKHGLQISRPAIYHQVHFLLSHKITSGIINCNLKPILNLKFLDWNSYESINLDLRLCSVILIIRFYNKIKSEKLSFWNLVLLLKFYGYIQNTVFYQDAYKNE